MAPETIETILRSVSDWEAFDRNIRVRAINARIWDLVDPARVDSFEDYVLGSLLKFSDFRRRIDRGTRS